MDKGYFAVDQPTHEDIVAVADRSRHREDLSTLRMGPPATSNRFSGDDLSQGRDGPSRGLEHDTVLANESESLARSHRDVFLSAQLYVKVVPLVASHVLRCVA